ncbi:MAG: hypothetical protein JSR46_09995, partial [Verrucomicrobia bacterium]|nr:hypothetical protein [Verrucomicrobiota bacterium]
YTSDNSFLRAASKARIAYQTRLQAGAPAEELEELLKNVRIAERAVFEAKAKVVEEYLKAQGDALSSTKDICLSLFALADATFAEKRAMEAESASLGEKISDLNRKQPKSEEEHSQLTALNRQKEVLNFKITKLKELTGDDTTIQAIEVTSANPSIKFSNINSFNTEELRKEYDDKAKTQKRKVLSEALSLLDNESTKKLPTRVVEIDQLDTVRNSEEICIASKTLRCTQNDQTFELDVAVAMRKGSVQPNLPKAMGEDAFLVDSISVTVGEKSYEIPIMATLDGGGGHTLAQFGRKNLKETFERHVNQLVSARNGLDASIVAEALRRSDKELFAEEDRDTNQNFP